MRRKVIYYDDELKDDFVNIDRKTIKITEDYKYIKKNIFWKICSFIVYRIIVMPFGFIYMKLKFGHKIINKKCIRPYKNKSYFVYGNHTLMGGDAFIPNIINYPKRTYVIVHPDNISQRLTKPFIEMCGAIPLPSGLGATKNFLKTIKYRTEKGDKIQIYPEAHIWPYYTGIRPFGSVSFKYPIICNVPIFVITNTYHKKLLGKTPKVITYIDGSLYVDESIKEKKEQEKDLRDRVYETMLIRSKNNTYNYYEYVRRKEND